MNDNELIAVLREQRGKVPMTTPLPQIISRGRTVRARRRIPGLAAGVGVAAAAAVAVSVALPASHPASHLGASRPASGPGARLAAWTVTRQADGNIQVTFREMSDAAGLQSVLRADGVPASVTFPGPQNPACRDYPVPPPPSTFLPRPGHPGGGPLSNVLVWPHPNLPQDALLINPAALPSGAGLALFGQGTDNDEPYAQEAGAPAGLSAGLVQASPQCTGS